MIWLVDYTHYEKAIDPRLAKCKQDYFRLKSYTRFQRIGPTAPVKSRVFATGLLRLATILHRNIVFHHRSSRYGCGIPGEDPGILRLFIPGASG